MMTHTRNKSYNLVNHEETKALARQIKSVLTRKGYTINIPLLIDALNSSTVKNIECFCEHNEIDFTAINLLKSLDSDCIISYFLSNTRKWGLHDTMKELFSAIVSARVWLRDNNNEPFDFLILSRSFILDVIENELLTHEELPKYIIKNILSYLDDLKKHFSRDGNISKEGLQEAHGYFQMILTRPFFFIGDDFSQLKYNESVYHDIKLLSYDMGIYLKGQKNNIKHSDLIESIVIALGYKNHHVYSAEYKILNKSHLYKDKIKNTDCLFEKGMSSQIMNAIIDYMPVNKNNIRGLHLIGAITKILVYIREKEKKPIIFDSIVSLLDLDVYQLSEIIEKYESLTGLNQYKYELSSPFDFGGNYKIFSAQKCFELYSPYLSDDDDDKKLYETEFKEKHKYITECLKKALASLKNKGIK